LWGVINGVHTFTANMIAQGTPALIINTGSKQGITCPPGNPAYNVSKAAIKAATESLQHELRNTENCMITAHLLVPGFTYTGMIRQFLPERPDDAWTSEQVVEFMVQSVTRGDFYILCPDNDITREVDNKRMAWAMGDLVENRPPLPGRITAPIRANDPSRVRWYYIFQECVRCLYWAKRARYGQGFQRIRVRHYYT
jgi:NAD(P)-dependent dehydrogenase (short-subunit alcohol dehydrogenase family)